jgi:HJR/Mrr/RecB family endonuclease
MTINILLQGFINSIPGLFKLFISTWYVWEFLLLIVVVRIGYGIYQHYLLSKAGMLEIDKMTGEQFEERLQILFTNLGYKAERTSSGKVKPDYGVDLVVEKDGIRTAIQAKCWKEKVPEKAVQAVFAGKNMYNCTEAIAITNSNFTKMAWRLARVDNVKLWSRNYLVKVLLTEKSLKSKKNNLTS